MRGFRMTAQKEVFRLTVQFSLDNKVAVVTGGSRGIGQAASIGLAQFGADVVVTATPGRLEGAEAVVREIKSLGRRALACPLDVKDLKSIDGTVAKTLAAFGQVDILVNNAGVNIPKPATEVTEADWDTVLDTNLKGLFFCCQGFGRHMVAQGSGKIINISSSAGVVGEARSSAYCSSKGGVNLLTKVLAIEWAPYNVTVNAVGPTWIDTDLTRSRLQDPVMGPEILRGIPVGRAGQPEDVVGAVVYLASPAADLVTGHLLLVDGGCTAW